MSSSEDEEPLLSVTDLGVRYHESPNALRGVSLRVGPAERVGVVGESGSGKSTLALALIGLLPDGTQFGDGSSIRFTGVELIGAPSSVVRAVRGHGIAMVFQDPMRSLNPVRTVGSLVGEVIRRRDAIPRSQATRMVEEALAAVGFANAGEIRRRFPHELSGGMRQRVMLAMALAVRPQVLLADEPTTALDVSVQDQVLRLIDSKVEEHQMALVLISHDLAVVSALTDRIYVMYAGLVVETGSISVVLSAPAHPYTVGLMRAMPLIGARERKLRAIPGEPPDARSSFRGCPFAARCERATTKCGQERPELRPVEALGVRAGRLVACFHPVTHG